MNIFVVSPIVKTAAFQSEYDVACESLNNHLSKVSFQTILAHRRDELQKICARGNSFTAKARFRELT